MNDLAIPHLHPLPTLIEGAPVLLRRSWIVAIEPYKEAKPKPASRVILCAERGGQSVSVIVAGWPEAVYAALHNQPDGTDGQP